MKTQLPQIVSQTGSAILKKSKKKRLSSTGWLAGLLYSWRFHAPKEIPNILIELVYTVQICIGYQRAWV
jgi:hypothetical protein